MNKSMSDIERYKGSRLGRFHFGLPSLWSSMSAVQTPLGSLLAEAGEDNNGPYKMLAVLGIDVERGQYFVVRIGGKAECVVPLKKEDVLRLLQPLGLAEEKRFEAKQDATSVLSQREIEVLQCVADGLCNKEIARRLGIGENTTKRHLQRIFAKLGVCSRTQAVMTALSKGWVTICQTSAPPL